MLANLPSGGTPPVQLGRYEIISRLAAGGMGEILLGRILGPHQFERAVVIKRILPHLAADPAMLNSFVAEARIAARIQHARVVHVHELVQIEDGYFLVMEYVEGESIGGLMRCLWQRSESLDRVLGAHIIAEACAGLHAAHELRDDRGSSLGVVHRDISPQNIMVSYAGEVKILDFGIAKAHDSERTKTGQVRGKCEYMSPEQCRGEPLDRRSDIFSLGVVLYELTVGHRLFKREHGLLSFAAICEDPIPRPSEIDPAYPPALEQICMRALARDRRDRYASALEMRRDLVAAVRSMASDCDRAGEEELLAELMPRLFGDRMREKQALLRDPAQGTTSQHALAAAGNAKAALPSRRYRTLGIAGLATIAIAMATPAVFSVTAADSGRRAVAPARACPCPPGQACDIQSNRCIALATWPTAAQGSVVYNARLYSFNDSEPIYAAPATSAKIINRLKTRYSWFRCWKAGAPHGEGTIWYYTRGDQDDREGWVRGDQVHAPSDFEANPTAFGFMPCDGQ